MPEPYEELANLNRLIHEPARLAILTALSACEAAEFLFLQRLTGLTKGNLGSHLATLERADLIWIEKREDGKRTRTVVGLKRRGRQAVAEHWERLEALGREARAAQLRPAPEHG